MTVAIVDLGTNTFNLLVAQIGEGGQYRIVHENKYPVRLGEGGLTQRVITPDAWRRGMEAVGRHIQTAQSLSATRFFAFATSAVRDAKNGKAFVAEIHSLYGLTVEIIDGFREASLIYQGVRQAIALGNECSLILDIGGGSNEIILASAGQTFWLKSFNLGVSRLTQLFAPADPIPGRQVEAIENHIAEALKPLFDAVKAYRPTRMVGSSGSFDSFRSILERAGKIPTTSSTWAEIPVQDYLALHTQLIASTRAERLKIAGLEPIRVDLIVIASIFVNLLVKRLGVGAMFQSEYALKEGFLGELAASLR